MNKVGKGSTPFVEIRDGQTPTNNKTKTQLKKISNKTYFVRYRSENSKYPKKLYITDKKIPTFAQGRTRIIDTEKEFNQLIKEMDKSKWQYYLYDLTIKDTKKLVRGFKYKQRKPKSKNTIKKTKPSKNTSKKPDNNKSEKLHKEQNQVIKVKNTKKTINKLNNNHNKLKDAELKNNYDEVILLTNSINKNRTNLSKQLSKLKQDEHFKIEPIGDNQYKLLYNGDYATIISEVTTELKNIF